MRPPSPCPILDRFYPNLPTITIRAHPTTRHVPTPYLSKLSTRQPPHGTAIFGTRSSHLHGTPPTYTYTPRQPTGSSQTHFMHSHAPAHHPTSCIAHLTQTFRPPSAPKIGFAYLLPLMGGIQDLTTRRFAMISSTWRCLGEEYSLQDMLARDIFSK